MTARHARSVFVVALLAIDVHASPSVAQVRWIDDKSVLAAGSVRLSVGAAGVWRQARTLTNNTIGWGGSGVSFAEALGIGHGLELGVRFGLRLDEGGRSLRADEVARIVDFETFGTGLSVAPNPEAQVRWSVVRWARGEVGLKERLVFPIKLDPNVTELLGVWTSTRFGQQLRLDVGADGVLGLQTFAAKRIVVPGLGIPVALWDNITRALFAGVLTTTRYVGGTAYGESYTQFTAGVGVGYRLGSCDLSQVTYLIDVFRDFARLIGVGAGLSCRL